MLRASIPVLALLVASACSPPRVATVATGSDAASTSEGSTDPGWDDETTAKPGSGDDAHDEAGDDGPRYDVHGGPGKLDVAGADHGCPEPLPSTLVQGETNLGAFTGIHAYFGDAWGEITLVIYDDDADLDHELNYASWSNGNVDQGPAIAATAPVDYEQVPNEEVLALAHVVGDEQILMMATITLDEFEFDAGVPDVPAVIRGTITPWPQDAPDAVSGSFAATRCGVFENFFPIE